jgi:catechol 2,3-dioxygenase-like lactoylglutathione lyase family enzyme
MTDSVQVERLDHVTVNVTDVDRAKAFYTEVLGLREVPRPASFTFPGAWYTLGPGPILLHLVRQPDADPKTSRHFAIWTADVHAAGRALEAAGCSVRWDRTKIPGIDRFFTNDPDGNLIEIQGKEIREGNKGKQ